MLSLLYSIVHFNNKSSLDGQRCSSFEESDLNIDELDTETVLISLSQENCLAVKNANDTEEFDSNQYYDLSNAKIAEFNKEELLEIINLIKISYYPSDYNLNNDKFSELQKRGYLSPSQLQKEGYEIYQFYDAKNGRHAGYIFIKDREVNIVYRGSRNAFDVQQDAKFLFTDLPSPPFSPNSKAHRGFYDLFVGSFEDVYKVLTGYANDQEIEIKDLKINIAGHSMGGAIANIAALYLRVKEDIKNLRVVTLGSPRVFDDHTAITYQQLLGKHTIRIDNRSDIVPSLPHGFMGYKHVGQRLIIDGHSYQQSHQVDTYRNLILQMEITDFKADNSFSIWIYPSQITKFVAPTILNVIGNSILYPYDDNQQYFKSREQRFENASLDRKLRAQFSDLSNLNIHENSDGFMFISLHNIKNSKLRKPILTPYIEQKITTDKFPLDRNSEAFSINLSRPKTIDRCTNPRAICIETHDNNLQSPGTETIINTDQICKFDDQKNYHVELVTNTKNETTILNQKKNKPLKSTSKIAISTLIVFSIVSVALAIYLKALLVGIIIGSLCLVSSVAIYYTSSSPKGKIDVNNGAFCCDELSKSV